ncbi:MAG: fucose isomerase, partial [Verrucomicrobiota bacterium]
MSALQNTPSVKLAIVGVSRDCFPIELTGSRLDKVVEASQPKVGEIHRCSVVVENELHVNDA